MTSVSNVVVNPEGDFYGAKLETPSVHPGMAAWGSKWEGGAAHKRNMLQYPNLASIIVLSRDAGAGHVCEGEAGRPLVSYRLADKDARSCVAGLVAALRILLAAGASQVQTGTAWAGKGREGCSCACASVREVLAKSVSLSLARLLPSNVVLCAHRRVL